MEGGGVSGGHSFTQVKGKEVWNRVGAERTEASDGGGRDGESRAVGGWSCGYLNKGE